MLTANSDETSCEKCDSFAPYNCNDCLRQYCADHIDDHSEI